MNNQMATNRVRRTSLIRAASRGQTMIEYALLLAAIALTAFGGMRTTGQKLTSSLNTSTAQVGSRASGGGGVTTNLPDAS